MKKEAVRGADYACTRAQGVLLQLFEQKIVFLLCMFSYLEQHK